MPFYQGRYVTYKWLMENHPPLFYKNKRIGVWIARGLTTDEELVYEIFMRTEVCDNCGVKLDKTIKKGKGDDSWVMDHDHETGEFRNILCQKCNLARAQHDNIMQN